MSLAAGAEIGFGAKIAFGIGASLVLSGVSNLLFPLETPTEPEDDPRVTYSFQVYKIQVGLELLYLSFTER
ncbi:MAG: hypothetical protein CM15mV46_260 [Caudoviricetes sp.]|nr:MAG: hypothetical protein CM15mV46_260 [Caudoviricetes sp.]